MDCVVLISFYPPLLRHERASFDLHPVHPGRLRQIALEAMEARYPHLKFEVARIPYPDDEAACIPFLGVVGDGVPRRAVEMPTKDMIGELNAALAEALSSALLN